jgi:hypothetical protein
VKRRKKKGPPRPARSLPVKHLARLVVLHAEDARQPGENLPVRPRKRGECVGVPRPCPFVTCEMNNYSDINPVTGTLHLNGHEDPSMMAADRSCAYDVAEEGGITLEEVGAILKITRERTRQIQVKALGKLKKSGINIETMFEIARAELSRDD